MKKLKQCIVEKTLLLTVKSKLKFPAKITFVKISTSAEQSPGNVLI